MVGGGPLNIRSCRWTQLGADSLDGDFGCTFIDPPAHWRHGIGTSVCALSWRMEGASGASCWFGLVPTWRRRTTARRGARLGAVDVSPTRHPAVCSNVAVEARGLDGPGRTGIPAGCFRDRDARSTPTAPLRSESSSDPFVSITRRGPWMTCGSQAERGAGCNYIRESGQRRPSCGADPRHDG